MRKAAVQGASCRVAGFTLLEVLIATSILGIMMVLLFGSMRICIRSWEAGEAHMQKVSRMTVIQNFFRSHLRSALTFPDSKNPGDFEEQEPFFQGEEHKLQFVSLLPASAGRSGPHLFQVQWDADSEASLRVALQPFPPSQDDGDAEIEDVTILENISNFQVAYWGAKEEGDQPEWHNEWLDVQVLPEMVRVDIELENEKPWPSIVVALRMAQHSDEQ